MSANRLTARLRPASGALGVPAATFLSKVRVPCPGLDDNGGRALLGFRHTIPDTVIPGAVLIDHPGTAAARVIGPGTCRKLQALLIDEIASGGSVR